MDLRTTGSVFVVLFCSVEVVLGQNWGGTYPRQSVCALEGASATLSCSYTYPRGSTVTRTEWRKFGQGHPYNLQDQPEYAGRVQYGGDKEREGTLTITDLRDTDSGRFYFYFETASPSYGETVSRGIHLSVTALQVTVTEDYWQATLTCSSTCSLTGSVYYIWYKNNQYLREETRNQYKPVYSNDVNSYSCAVKGHEDLPSPAVCVSGQKCWSVNYSNRKVCALMGSSVDLSCTYTHPSYLRVTKAFWFIGNDDQKDLKVNYRYTSRVEYSSSKVNHHAMKITNLGTADTAVYKFRMITNSGGYTGSAGVQLTVTDIQVEIKRSFVTEGDEVSMTCRTVCPLGLSVSWFRNGDLVTNRGARWDILYLDSVRREDAGRYSCALTEHPVLHSPEKTLNVTYKPKDIKISVSPSGAVVEGSSVTLTCNSDANPPVQTYTWYKKTIASSETPGQDNTITTSRYEDSGQNYTITTSRSEDSGQYWCSAQNLVGSSISREVLINVLYKPRSLTVSVNPSGAVVEGSSVTLTCNSDANPPVQTYTWYKKTIASSETPGQNYTITTIRSKDSGQNYTITTSRSEDSGQNYTITTSRSEDSGQNYTITTSRSEDSGQNYTIATSRSEDSGGYFCQAENQQGRTNSSSVVLNVHYAPRSLSVSVNPSGAVVEGSSVTLTCNSDANPPVQTYTWYKKTIASSETPGQNYTITTIRSKDSGQKYTITTSRSEDSGQKYTITTSRSEDSGQKYTITTFRSEDSGGYFCQAGNTVGTNKSAVVMITLLTGMSEALQAAAAVTTVIVLLIFILLSAFLLCRKKTLKPSSSTRPPSFNEQGDCGPVYDNILAIALTHTDTHTDTQTDTHTDQQDDIHYANIDFSRLKTKDVPLYSTVQSVQPQNQEEDVQYTAVKFNELNPAPRVDVPTDEDPSALYSTINKPKS